MGKIEPDGMQEGLAGRGFAVLFKAKLYFCSVMLYTTY